MNMEIKNIPGVAGVVDGSVLPGYIGIEAGQSAVGDIFNWFVSGVLNRDSDYHNVLTEKADKLKAGQSGLLSLDWNNGNRNVLADFNLTGLILGQTLHTKDYEIYRALIEATAFGALIMVVLSLTAPLISSFYGHPELRWLVVLISTAFLFSGMSIQHQALLRRRMQFGRLALLRCGSIFIAHILAVLLAIWGAGVWALASVQVCTPLFMLFGCFIALPWTPSLPRRDTPVKDLVGFGGNVAGFGIITYFARNMD